MNCDICEQIDLNIPNTENAKRLGVSEATIRRHRAHMATDTDTFFDTVPIASITSRGKTVRLADGSYEKVTYSPARAAMLEAVSYDDLERAIERYKPPPRPPKPTTDKTFVLGVADLQVGKAREDQGGTPELVEKVMTSLHKAVAKVKKIKPAEIVLGDVGDVIENFYNTSSQRETNDLDLTTQIRTARRLLMAAITLMAPLAPKVTFFSVPSNHGSVRIGPRSPASTSDNDFGLEINHQLEDVFAGRPEFQHVNFVRPERLAESVIIETSGTTLGAVHGHQARGADKVGDWWRGQSHGRRNGLQHARILVVGHWHHLNIYPSGDNRMVFVCPTSDVGSTYFANSTGETSKSGMLSFVTHNNEWEDIEIL